MHQILKAYIFDNQFFFVPVCYYQIPDGVNSLVIGKLANTESPLVVAGGNCTLQGFDAAGEDQFWTVRCLLLDFHQIS